MSVRLRREQCCVSRVEGKPRLRPAREPGGLCSQCWRGLEAIEWALLEWEAAARLPDPMATFDVDAVIAAILGRAT